MLNGKISWYFCLFILLFVTSCGDEGKCGKACGWDLGFERGNGPDKVCFCQTSDGRIYGPVPMGEDVQAANQCLVPDTQEADPLTTPHEPPYGISIAEDKPDSCSIQ